MAKPPVKVEEKKNIAVRQSNLPSYIDEIIDEDAGLGTSQLAQDNLLPLIYVLQTNSPQVNRRDPQYVQGAEPGDIWPRGADFVWKGDEGIEFQHCFFHTAWCEWDPTKRGQFKGHHVGGTDQIPPAHLHAFEEEYTNEKGNKKKRWALPNGDVVVFTRYHVGHVVTPDGEFLPFVIPFSSTGHTVSKDWMTKLNSKKRNGKVAPAPSLLWRLTTRLKSNDEGSWFLFKVTDENAVISTLEDYQVGKTLALSFKSGEKGIQDEEASFGHVAEEHTEDSAM